MKFKLIDGKDEVWECISDARTGEKCGHLSIVRKEYDFNEDV